MSQHGQQPHGHSRALRAFVAAVVVAFLIPVVLLIVSTFITIGTVANNIAFVVSILVVGTMLIRAFLLLQADRRGRR